MLIKGQGPCWFIPDSDSSAVIKFSKLNNPAKQQGLVKMSPQFVKAFCWQSQLQCKRAASDGSLVYRFWGWSTNDIFFLDGFVHYEFCCDGTLKQTHSIIPR